MGTTFKKPADYLIVDNTSNTSITDKILEYFNKSSMFNISFCNNNLFILTFCSELFFLVSIIKIEELPKNQQIKIYLNISKY
jgi:hypothetical protein